MANTRKSRSADLSEYVASQIDSLLPVRSSILIGLSGGVDSVVLLHILKRLATRFDWNLTALHVHHGISPNADDWADFCTDLCENNRIPLKIEHVDIAPMREHGIEAAARKLRHHAFERQPCDVIALAHHADDQAETLLLQLLRGSGVRGASAMPLFTKREGLPDIFRPLLNSSRQEICDYAQTNGLKWIEDESNEDDSYPRNFLRHRVFPLLNEKFPSYRENLSRSTRHFAEASELLDQLAMMDIGPDMEADSMSVATLRSLPMIRAKNLLRYFLHRQGAPYPQSIQLEEMLNQLCDARQDASVSVQFGDHQVRRYQDRVYLLPLLPEFDRDLILPWDGKSSLEWPPLCATLQVTHSPGNGISIEKLRSAPLTFRLRNGSESIRTNPAASRYSLRNLLQRSHIPPWTRERLPLLYCGDELACVVGVAINADFQAKNAERGVVVSYK